MKFISVQLAALCTIANVFSVARSPISIIPQKPLTQVEAMIQFDDTAKVPGNNNATYGPIPKASQLFEIEMLEIAPRKILVDEIFFLLLRGEIPRSKTIDQLQFDELLTSATLTITLSAILSNGKHENERNYSVPLRTTAYADIAHLAIRNATGAHVEYLSSRGSNDILTDYWIPGMFLRTGSWTFKVAAELGDGTCLFAIALTQWLEGRLH